MTTGASGSASHLPAATSGSERAPAPAPSPKRAKPSASDSPLRTWLAFDERPALIELAATPAGRVMLFGCFGALLCFALPVRTVPCVLAGAAGVAFWKARRDHAIFLATLAVLALDPVWFIDASFQSYVAQFGVAESQLRNLERLLTVVLFGLAALGLRFVATHPTTFLAKRPVVTLLSAITAATVCGVVLHSVGIESLWLVVAIKLLAAYTWFISYAVVDQRAKQRGSLLFALGMLRPFWGSSSTPIGKNPSYLTKLRAGEPSDLARVQLKGLKLLMWSFVLEGASVVITLSTTHAGVRPLEDLVRALANGERTPVLLGWLAMIVAVTVGALELAVWGHRIVACARLAGFHLRRNTWRPLESRTLADFWNRYYYYFKELLLDFFFYPTFFRAFKKSPRLRTFCATFMAAGVGNAIYHFVRDIDQVFSLGPAIALQGYGSYVFYCLTLASGIAFSQLRTGNAPRANTLRARVGGFLTVWGFVVVLHVFGGIEDRTLGFTPRVAFTLHQLGLGT